MPRIVNDNDDMESRKITGGNFSFSGTRVNTLGATEYTLVTIAVDVSGSVSSWEKELRDALIAAVESCKKSPRSDNLLLRVITFSDQYDKGINEIHGFKPLNEIDPAGYPNLQPRGGTPLCDACFSAIGAMNTYGKQLADSDFGVNGIVFIITDGEENTSVATMKMVKDEAQKSISGEILESTVSILVGINAGSCASALQNFKDEAGITQFIDAGDATKSKLAKLASFVSQSISSQSQALGTSGPSQNILASI